jgi:hypothetical protein
VRGKRRRKKKKSWAKPVERRSVAPNNHVRPARRAASGGAVGRARTAGRPIFSVSLPTTQKKSRMPQKATSSSNVNGTARAGVGGGGGGGSAILARLLSHPSQRTEENRHSGGRKCIPAGGGEDAVRRPGRRRTVRFAAARGGEEQSPENHRRGARGLAREAMGVQDGEEAPKRTTNGEATPRLSPSRQTRILLSLGFSDARFFLESWTVDARGLVTRRAARVGFFRSRDTRSPAAKGRRAWGFREISLRAPRGRGSRADAGFCGRRLFALGALPPRPSALALSLSSRARWRTSWRRSRRSSSR